MKKGQLINILMLFIILVIGISLAVILGDSFKGSRTKGSVINESLSISSGTGQTANVGFFVETVDFFGNGTNSTNEGWPIGPLSPTAFVNWTPEGVVSVNTTRIADGTYNLSYTWIPTTYIQEPVSRRIVPLTLLFFVIFLMIFSFDKIKDKLGF